ncbi:MAG TPA: hypothetical protein VIA18_22415, partial [Polyangia bacterium]|nr:hypothetical protein [Polyangia bacterium]
ANVRARLAPLWARLPASWRAVIARDSLLFTLFVALWICALLPIWVPRFLPLLDLPDHLDAIAIWHRYHDTDWRYSQYYILNLFPFPYWGYFFPVHLLSYVFPIEIANKLYLSAYALALPLSLLILARRFGRSPWLALFAFPLVFNMNFTYGFITFCAGIVVLTFALVVLDRFLELPTKRRAWALALLTLGLYSTHVLPWAFFGVATIVLVFCHGYHPRRIAAAFALESPSLLLAAYAFTRAHHGKTAIQPGPLHFEATFEGVLSSLQSVPTRLVSGWPGDAPYYMLLVLGLVWLALLLTAHADEPAAPARPGFAYRLELVIALAAAAYLFLPMHLLKPVDLWMIGGRFLAIVALFGALLPRGTIRGHRRLLFIPVIVISILYPSLLARKWLQFDRRAGSFRRLVKQIERGSSTLTIVTDDGLDPSADAQAAPYIQFHAYVQFLVGGYEPWALSSGFPYYERPGVEQPAPRWKHPETFNFDANGATYDYILTKAEFADHGIFGPDDAGRAPLVARDGDWRLYKVRH